MGFREQSRNRQIQGATGNTIATGSAGTGIVLLKPMAGIPRHPVALFGMAEHVVAKGQIAQPQQFRNRHLIRAGQAFPALAAMAATQSLLSLLLQIFYGIAFPCRKGSISFGQLLGPIQIAWFGCPKAEAADPLGY